MYHIGMKEPKVSIDGGASPLPRFIVFEGLDGAGTTTQSVLLDDRLRRSGRRSWLTSEPTTGPIGILCRRVLSGEIPADPDTIAHLFATDRSAHLNGADGIRQHLDDGYIVICDRYRYSSLVYQGAETDVDFVRALNARFESPALVVFLDLSPEAADARLAGRTSREIYERIEFQHAVRANYLREMEIAGRETRVVMFDGTEEQHALAEKVWEAVADASIL